MVGGWYVLAQDASKTAARARIMNNRDFTAVHATTRCKVIYCLAYFFTCSDFRLFHYLIFHSLSMHVLGQS
jgi:hypothetical protein